MDIKKPATKRLRFFSDFCTPEVCCDVMKRLHPNWEKDLGIEFTAGNDYTHVIILNTCMPDFSPHVPRENVLGLAFEPRAYLSTSPQFVEYARRHIGRYLVGDATGLGGPPFVETFSYMWHTAPPLPPLKEKRRIASLMISRKLWGPGNKYRHVLAKSILNSNLPIDIWGNGCELLKHPTTFSMSNITQNTAVTDDVRIRGDFVETEPYEDYAFHIAIENYQSGHYMSEKILNSLVYGCTPVYLGSPHVDIYFPGMVICLNGNIDQDMRILERICAHPASMRRRVDLEHLAKVFDMSRELV
jgi:hypothetical protein